MALSFPANPAVNDVFQKWKWSGSGWDQIPPTVVSSWNGRDGPVTMTAADVTAVGGALKPGNRVLINSNKTTSFVGWVPIILDDPPAYDVYEIEWFGFKCSADAALLLQIGHDSTWETAGQYYYAYAARNTTNTDSSFGGTGSAIWLGSITTAGSSLASGIARIYLPGATDRPKHIHYKSAVNTSGNLTVYNGFGFDWNPNYAQPVKSLRLMVNAGGLNAGLTNWYGIGNGSQRG